METETEEKRVFECSFVEAKQWKNVVDAMAVLVDEVVFVADEKSLKARAMDPSRVSMFDLEIPDASFGEYRCSGNVKMAVNLEEMARIMRRAGSNDELTLRLDAERNKLSIVLWNGTAERTFKIGLLDMEYEEMQTPSIDTTAEVRMVTGAFRGAVKDAVLVSDSAVLTAREDAFEVSARGDVGSVEVRFDRASDDLLQLEVEEETVATYALNYLDDIMKTVSETMTIRFGSNMPLCLEFALSNGGLITYWLAPRIETE